MGIESIIGGNQTSTPLGDGNPKALGKDDFLKLMLIQMRHQDPLNPMDNQQTLSQMAEFSGLEQMSNLNETLTASNNLGIFMDSTRLLGKEIDFIDPYSDPDNPVMKTSTVQGISFTTAGPVLTLEDGSPARIQDIIRVGNKVVAEPAAPVPEVAVEEELEDESEA